LFKVVDKSKKDSETSLSPVDFANVPKREIDLKSLGINVKPDPTLGNKIEGDIAVDAFSSRFRRGAVRQSFRRWPDGEIPYAISTQYGPYSRSIIANAMQEYHKKTCLRFVPRDPLRHRNYIYIYPDDGCYSLVGKSGGRQPLSLDSGCIQTGTIVHELMHVTGFFHEQSRSDRDKYISIIWENIMEGAEDQFEKYGTNVVDLLGEDYDYSSIMHYGPYAFTGNGRRTIVALKPGSGDMGQRRGFSTLDMKKLNKLYSCSDKTPSITTTAKPTEKCEDTHWRCVFWSMSIFSYCERSKQIAQVECRKSCGNCDSKLVEIEENKTNGFLFVRYFIIIFYILYFIINKIDSLP
uniref:Metalloendopeptidase n=1 Tax=Dracunculus medinensis TaxID=318479 RepID=A0A0N4UF60_DRAME